MWQVEVVIRDALWKNDRFKAKEPAEATLKYAIRLLSKPKPSPQEFITLLGWARTWPMVLHCARKKMAKDKKDVQQRSWSIKRAAKKKKRRMEESPASRRHRLDQRARASAERRLRVEMHAAKEGRKCMEDNTAGRQHQLDHGAHIPAERRLRAVTVVNPEQVKCQRAKTRRCTVDGRLCMNRNAAAAL